MFRFLDECQLNRTSVKSELYFIFNPIKGRKWNVGAEQYGKIWQAGDIIGPAMSAILYFGVWLQLVHGF
jgi:hypothetical protein